ncbi:uncharacterized protein LOC126899856 [Daktulosphaira vitifoliae]|uniref:uncharacterized protein LOC126899856 n=1 Tax=Daktulosphaira vitifoliae TaxID=58002 RepID=UPI0021AA332C|nr:uncharacterized protein LOC126899856 [Daktulosphaira vitifoliae]XP_050531042.1 uncharacterized protein LOC126899856 [Daktulosphaira vitifoliae]
MTSRKRIVLKPLSLTTTQQSRVQSNVHETSNTQIQNSSFIHGNNEKKRVLLSPESCQPKVPIIQRSRVPVPIINGNLSDTDSDDSSHETKDIIDRKLTKPLKNNNYSFYVKVVIFLCWLFIQYWMIVEAGFGAVFFVCSALIAIYLNTSNSHKRRNTLSAYSVFNPQCISIQGSADPKQLERELMFSGL